MAGSLLWHVSRVSCEPFRQPETPRASRKRQVARRRRMALSMTTEPLPKIQWRSEHTTRCIFRIFPKPKKKLEVATRHSMDTFSIMFRKCDQASKCQHRVKVFELGVSIEGLSLSLSLSRDSAEVCRRCGRRFKSSREVSLIYLEDISTQPVPYIGCALFNFKKSRLWSEYRINKRWGLSKQARTNCTRSTTRRKASPRSKHSSTIFVQNKLRPF